MRRSRAINPQGEPTTLLEIRHASAAWREADPTSSGDRREQAALRRVGLWGVVLGTLAMLLVSALLGAMPGVP